MLKLLEAYLYPIIHPFKYQDSLVNNIPIESQLNGELEKLEMTDAIAISWLVKVIRAVIHIFVLYFFTNTIFSFTLEDSEFANEFIPGARFDGYVLIVIGIVLETIFYPILTLIFMELWTFMIRVYATLLGTDRDEDKVAEQIMTASLSSTLFEIVPFVGEFFKSISNLVILYAGLRRNLKASKALSVLIISTPFLLIISLLMVVSLLIIALAA